MKKTIIAAAAVLVLAAVSFGAGISGVPVLNMNSGAVSASLAGVCMARGGGDSIWYNPAGLASLEKSTSDFTYFADMAGFYNMFLNTAFVIKGTGSIGVSLAYSGSGSIDNAVEGGAVEARDMVGALGYSQIVTSGVRAGLSLKYVDSKLASFETGAFAADVGVLWDINDMVTAGAAVKNIGSALKYDTEVTPLPMTAGIGAAIKAIKADAHVLNFGADVIYAITDKAIRAGASVEYIYSGVLSLRAGYMYEDKSASGLGLGAGIKTGLGWGDMEVDYAYAPSYIGTSNTENRHLVTVVFSY